MNKALFLDRDGVINVDHGYLYQIDQFEFVDGIIPLCQRAMALGYQIIVVTNQSGIGRGYYSEQGFWTLSDWMCEAFAKQQVDIKKVYFCPHHPTKAQAPYLTECECRKPKPGMLLSAIAEFAIDPEQSIMVGDKISDMQAGFSAGVVQRYWFRPGQSTTLNKNESQWVTASVTDLSQLLDKLL